MARPSNEELNALKEELESLINSGNELVSKLESHDSEFSNLINTISAQSTAATKNSEEIEDLKHTAEEAVSEIHELKTTSTTDFHAIQQLSEMSSEISETISTQESKLEQLSDNAEELKKTIEELLPGATSAGLASAFKDRKDSFIWPKRIWGAIFVASVIGLLAVAYFEPVSFEKATIDANSILQYFLVRLPFAIPIVWLAIYAGRRHSQALRLEEDYAHKEALSKSFEGYKTQLMDIEEGSEDKEATLNLIERTLEALSLHPGRIYQGKHDDISPVHSLANIFHRKKKSADEEQA